MVRYEWWRGGRGRLLGRSVVCFVVATTALTGGIFGDGVATAQAQSASEKAAAEALFDEGVELLKAKKYEEACRKLESSLRIESGIGTLLFLGECYKQLGRTASAWATFREAASKAEAAGERGRAEAGMKRADELEPLLSKVTFQVAEQNREIEGLRIQQAGLDVSRPLWGTPVPVDPGKIMVTAEAPGYEKFELEVKVKQGPAAIEVKIPPLVALPEEEMPAESAPESATSANPTEPVEASDPGAGRRTAGIVLGSAGVVGLGVGGIFGLVAMNHEKKARDVCTDNLCDPSSDGVDRTNKAQTAALVSTIGFVAGGALLAGGLVLYFTAPKTGEVATLQIGGRPGGASLTLGAKF